MARREIDNLIEVSFSEHQIQVRLFEWIDTAAGHEFPALQWLFAVPNGTRTSIGVGAKMKREGVRVGVPDLFLPCPNRRGQHGCFIEMKKRGGKVKPEQRAWLTHLAAQGYATTIARSWEEAAVFLLDYLGASEDVVQRLVYGVLVFRAPTQTQEAA